MKQDDWRRPKQHFPPWQLLQHFGVPLTEPPGEDFPTAVDLRQQQVDRWRKQLPALDRSVSLELRDQSLAEAIQSLATAAGLELTLKDGTLDDAAELLDRDQLRVPVPVGRITSGLGNLGRTPVSFPYSVGRGFRESGSNWQRLAACPTGPPGFTKSRTWRGPWIRNLMRMPTTRREHDLVLSES